MNDSAVDAHVQAAVRRYDEELNRAGFRTVSCGDTPSEWRWRGRIEEAGEKVEIETALTRRFPYGPPDVVLPDRAGRAGWHRGAGGVLCLWDSHTLGDLPWMDVPGLLERVRQWIAKDAGGWSDDDPALDLEAYRARTWSAEAPTSGCRYSYSTIGATSRSTGSRQRCRTSTDASTSSADDGSARSRRPARRRSDANAPADPGTSTAWASTLAK